MRFVIDTNLLVSGLMFGGLPRQLLDAARAGDFELCTSEVLLAELLDVLGRSKFADRIAQASLSPQILVDDLRKLAIVVTPTNVPRVVPTDPDDDHVLAAALAGAADLIASGDGRDLLPLGNYAGIPIVSAREAMERIAPR
ncbi:putative PIN family toxin of toxin-antitoxin system [Variovorax boronicumulans]|uniref:putative toxin-antitoxin system toxin component, PIN family n=1 Tax=Variovorax boronicumulans TaxID=436515 RepID=UPI002473EE6B|nr:putative toxin-antitoxin system toxin component, PIN family [Variovorax boronicumulans]MDH6170941.1 putative PIN family toxin of toxin-antitoxin system [Variovorax boronicumulans]